MSFIDLLLIGIITAVILWLVFAYKGRSNRHGYMVRSRNAKKVKWHDNDDNVNLPKDPEYKLIKLRKAHIKEVYNHNYLNPQQDFHEYGDEEETIVLGTRKSIGFFTGLIGGQRGFFNKYIKGAGFWVNYIMSQGQSKDTNRGL